jgi:phosphatidylserine/phosphatidylglycerophosphate/cardiolipin synthase-like enzyme
MKNSKKSIQFLLKWSSLLLITSCQSPVATNTQREPSAAAAAAEAPKHWLSDAPRASAATVSKLVADYEKKKRTALKKDAPERAVTTEQMEPLARYIEQLNLPATEKAKVTERLMESSLQFLTCNAEDWACLEKSPDITPLAKHRVDSVADLGKPVRINKPLDMKYFFTQQWYRAKKELIEEREVAIPERATLASELQRVIDQPWNRVSAAIYGIDGIGEIDKMTKTPNHSMDGVFAAIKSHPSARAVVDIEAYKQTGNKVEITYQYPPTQQLYDELNQNTTEASQRVRLEYPAASIMHNKFFVFEKGNNKSIWTGTSNISKNCTGDEDFANMAVYIKNNEIASAYLAEFEEMYNYMPGTQSRGPSRIGRFHQNKTPNTQRYFVFSDDTEATLHFSPTDDGEHRSILPVLLSARPGDELRISMFGSGGPEYVRAIQYAAAKGAKVRVFLDRDTTFQIPTSWINKKAPVKLDGPNPYGPLKGSLEVRYTNWKNGHMNHHKSATLTRKTGNGLKAEVLIVGSQNWSIAGNDQNDENMLTFRNLKQELQVAKDYNEHFDRMLWPTGKIVPVAAE